MELKVTHTIGSPITIKKTEMQLTVIPFDVSIRAIRSNIILHKGDILVGLGVGVAGIVVAGSPGQVLTPDATPSNPTGLIWVAAGGGANSTMTNAAGVELVNGDVVVIHPTTDRGINTTNVKGNLGVCGVVQDTIVNAAQGPVATVAGSQVLVKCDSVAVAKFDYLVTSTTPTRATTNGTLLNSSCFARALTSKGTGIGTVWAELLPMTLMPLSPSLSGLIVWLKAETLMGAYTEAGEISTWNDQSGSSNHFVMATAANKPTYRSAIINGYGTALFDGITDYLQRNALLWSGNAARTIFVVLKPIGTELRSYLSMGPVVTGADFDMQQGTGVGADATVTFYGVGLPGITDATTATRIHAATYDGTVARNYRNNSFIGALTTAINTALGAGVLLGYSMGAATYWNGYIAEVLGYNRCLTDAERVAVFQYLAGKYGVTIA